MNESRLKELRQEIEADDRVMLLVQEERSNAHIDTFKEYRSFKERLGHLAFTLAAAIGPISFLSQKDSIQDYNFVFLAMGLYLLVGFISLINAKNSLEEDLIAMPGVGIDLEFLTLQKKLIILKMVTEPTNKKFQDQYKKFNSRTPQEPIRPLNLGPSLDFLYLIFVVGTLFLFKAIWVGESSIYWIIFTLIVSIFIIVILFGRIRLLKKSFAVQEWQVKIQADKKAISDLLKKADDKN